MRSLDAKLVWTQVSTGFPFAPYWRGAAARRSAARARPSGDARGSSYRWTSARAASVLELPSSSIAMMLFAPAARLPGTWKRTEEYCFFVFGSVKVEAKWGTPALVKSDTYESRSAVRKAMPRTLR